jgi:hypothetical protein
MAFHGQDCQLTDGDPPLMRAEHAAVGDVQTQGHGLEGLLDHQVTLRLVK